jgi:hypothetical protein
MRLRRDAVAGAAEAMGGAGEVRGRLAGGNDTDRDDIDRGAAVLGEVPATLAR